MAYCMLTRGYPNRPLKLGISASFGWNWMKAPGPAKLGSKLFFHSVSHGDFKIDTWLVVYLPLWKILVKWDNEIPNIWKNKTCSKPPSSTYVNWPMKRHDASLLGKSPLDAALSYIRTPSFPSDTSMVGEQASTWQMIRIPIQHGI